MRHALAMAGRFAVLALVFAGVAFLLYVWVAAVRAVGRVKRRKARRRAARRAGGERAFGGPERIANRRDTST